MILNDSSLLQAECLRNKVHLPMKVFQRYIRADKEARGVDKTSPRRRDAGPQTYRIGVALFCARFTPFRFNAARQFAPLLNLRPVILILTPFGWLRTRTQPRLCRSHGAEQNWRDAWSLQFTSLTVRLPYGSDCLVYLHLFKFFCSPYCKRHDDTTSQKKN